jgi:hypothetical protein
MSRALALIGFNDVPRIVLRGFVVKILDVAVFRRHAHNLALSSSAVAIPLNPISNLKRVFSMVDSPL